MISAFEGNRPAMNIRVTAGDWCLDRGTLGLANARREHKRRKA